MKSVMRDVCQPGASARACGDVTDRGSSLQVISLTGGALASAR